MSERETENERERETIIVVTARKSLLDVFHQLLFII